MKGTFEEEMLRRGPNHEKLMENDEVMMNFLKNPKFIQPTSPNKELDTLINFPMFDVPNVVDRPSILSKTRLQP
ncbi:hypothetical protein FRC03_008257 [Tulasnella sp. 419]|nr:hypothetical protein FRC03_008257 [Tulasnella sp. 419]